jgi:alcohol dehydrogenase class IV
MGELHLLPQAAVLWGPGIVADAVGRLSTWGIERPIIFSAQALKVSGQTSVWSHVPDSVGLFTDLPAHAPESAIERALQACLTRSAAAIVAYGGGSVLDAAKAVSHRHHQETGRYLTIAAIPTTLSGSEFSHYFGVTEEQGDKRFKRSYAVSSTVPRLVVLDPMLLVDTPRALMLASAIKSLDHAIEGMRQISIDNPHAILAASGVRRLFSVLERWPPEVETKTALTSGLVSPDDLLALQLGAWHCYFAPASVVYGLSHRIGHVLGGTFGLPHSVTSCITLAPVIRATAGAYQGRLAIFSDGQVSASAPFDLAMRIASLVRALGLPERLGPLGLAIDCLPQIAALLKDHYPVEVGDLENGAQTLDNLLESLW